MIRGRILESWRRQRSEGRLLTGGPGGPDFLTVSNVDRLGLPAARSIAGVLPIGDANALSLAAARERVPQAGQTPLIAGICATDPLRLLDKFLLEVRAAGVAGVENLPSVGVFDGGFRTILENSELGYAREVEMVRQASAMDLLSAGVVFSAEDARAMARAGADLVVVHPGVGPGPSAKDWPRKIEECAAAARESRKDVLVLAYGSRASVAGDVPGLDGFQIE